MKLKSTIGRIMSVTLASVMLFNVTPLATATKAETKPAVVNEMIESFRVDTLSDTKNAEGFYLENLAIYADKISTPQVTTDDVRKRSS